MITQNTFLDFIKKSFNITKFASTTTKHFCIQNKKNHIVSSINFRLVINTGDILIKLHNYTFVKSYFIL